MGYMENQVLFAAKSSYDFKVLDLEKLILELEKILLHNFENNFMS
jgi:hypothetical protein